MLNIIYPGGQWSSNVRSLAPWQTFALDVRKLRDSQEKGSDGSVFPLGATSGHVSWSFRGKQNKVLIGRAQTVDFSNGLASTYECQCICGWSWGDEAQILPGSVTSFPGDVGFFQIRSRYRDCHGNDMGWLTLDNHFLNNYVTHRSTNPNVATFTAPATGTAIAPGSAYLEAEWAESYQQFDENTGICIAIAATALCAAFCDVQPPCAYPVNFRQTSVTDLGDGRLRFTYDWDSSTGVKADLGACRVGEIVTYDGPSPTFYWPSPPWAPGTNTANPEIGPIPPIDARDTMVDTHATLTFGPSIAAAEFTATQYYRYRCICVSGNEWQNFVGGGPIQIVRKVFFNQGPLPTSGQWFYQINKSGAQANRILQ